LSFSGNNRRFIEDLVFTFDKDEKIASLAFGLDQKAVDGIMLQTIWNEVERLTLINFMENYKTAYALKRIDYIESIFSDDALIIVGNVVKTDPSGNNPYKNNKTVTYNRLSKQDFIKRMRHTFASNEYINLKFEDSEIRKVPNTGKYGIQIKQNYFSTNYGDTGYLFLLIDFTDTDSPMIHVRTWQPERNPDGSVYGVSDFQ